MERTARVYWHEDEDALLRELWPDKSLTREEIGKRYNPPKTKNAIIGRAGRIGLERMKSRSGPQSQRTRTVSGVFKPRSVYTPLPEPEVLAEPLRIPIMEIREAELRSQCRAIVDTDEQNLAIFCGLKVPYGQNLSYCRQHLKLYTYPCRRR